MARKKKENPKKDLLERIRDRYHEMKEAEDTNRQKSMADLKFLIIPGEQWEPNMKKNRGDRPCYEFNKLRITSKRIINDMRANRVQGKVRASEDSDKETADIYEGLIRNIWNTSDGDTVVDYAAEYQVGSGFGAWRINTKYAHEDVFDQDIVVEQLYNPFNLYADPSAKDILKRDARDWILIDKLSKDEYEQRWPDKEVIEFDSSEFDDEWEDEESVRICEYWYKEPYDKVLWQLQDGSVVDAEESPELEPYKVKERVSQCYKIKSCIASGEAILEESEWAGKYFPFVLIYGDYLIIDGKVEYCGIARYGKDAQRSYNVARTAVTETIAMAPQAKFWATPEQANGHTDKWAEAHQKNFPFLLYNADPKAPGSPQRMGGPEVPVALIQELQLASEEIKAVTGIFDPSLGAQSNETSGRAIVARQRQGEIATFNYQDNLSKGIRYTWEILVDLIPKIYDTERNLRVLGPDGAENYVKINTIQLDQNGQPIPKNDLTTGKYDVVITVGPSFSTQRMEASDIYLQLAQTAPQVMAIAGDLIMKSLDLPYSEDIAERMKVMLPPQVQQVINEDKQLPPEVLQAMQQAEQAMMMVNQKMQEVQMAAQEIQGEQAKVEKGKSEIEKLIANLKTEEARFEARIAKEMANIAQKQADIQIKEVHQTTAENQMLSNIERDNLGGQVAQAIATINAITAQFMEQAAGILTEIQAKSQVETSKPKVVRIDLKRDKGQVSAVPVYENMAESS